MLASHVIAAPEIYFVPSLSGLGAPHWEPRARGSIFGMTRGTSREQLIRAALESIAFQVDELITTMNADAKAPIQLLRVDGGAAANNLLMQMQADLSSVTVDRPTNLESTALGAAMFAALGIGAFKNLDELSMIREADTIFEQRPNSDTTKVKAGWQRAIAATKVFSQI
jgi:glycerol kinase